MNFCCISKEFNDPYICAKSTSELINATRNGIPWRDFVALLEFLPAESEKSTFLVVNDQKCSKNLSTTTTETHGKHIYKASHFLPTPNCFALKKQVSIWTDPNRSRVSFGNTAFEPVARIPRPITGSIVTGSVIYS